MNSLSNGAAGEIRTPEVRHHRISNPAQWPGYATAAVSPAKLHVVMNMTVKNRSLRLGHKGPR